MQLCADTSSPTPCCNPAASPSPQRFPPDRPHRQLGRPDAWPPPGATDGRFGRVAVHDAGCTDSPPGCCCPKPSRAFQAECTKAAQAYATRERYRSKNKKTMFLAIGCWRAIAARRAPISANSGAAARGYCEGAESAMRGLGGGGKRLRGGSTRFAAQNLVVEGRDKQCLSVVGHAFSHPSETVVRLLQRARRGGGATSGVACLGPHQANFSGNPSWTPLP